MVSDDLVAARGGTMSPDALNVYIANDMGDVLLERKAEPAVIADLPTRFTSSPISGGAKIGHGSGGIVLQRAA